MMPHACIAGDPVAHSLSPFLHQRWLRALGLQGRYALWPVSATDFADQARRRFADPAFVGMNVTLPHKGAALALADRASAEAREIGAANLLVRRDGGIYADNTDVHGFLEPLLQSSPKTRRCGQKLVMLGAGGAARAALVALESLNPEQIIVLNRTDSRAEALASRRPLAKAQPWSQRQAAIRDAALLVNTSKAGMRGADALALEPEGLKPGALVYDLIYTPLQTPLLKAAQARGYETLNGLPMLIAQARPSFEAFFGVPPPKDDEATYRALVQVLEAAP